MQKTAYNKSFIHRDLIFFYIFNNANIQPNGKGREKIIGKIINVVRGIEKRIYDFKSL